MATTTTNQNGDAPVLHESAYCPECREIGWYIGKQMDTWTGTRRFFRTCEACGVTWSHKNRMPGRQ